MNRFPAPGASIRNHTLHHPRIYILNDQCEGGSIQEACIALQVRAQRPLIIVEKIPLIRVGCDHRLLGKAGFCDPQDKE